MRAEGDMLKLQPFSVKDSSRFSEEFRENKYSKNSTHVIS